MANSEIHPEGWVSVCIPDKFINDAKAIRHNRDQQYGNIYAETGTDKRWVGDLGEIAFKSWLKHEGKSDFQWVLDDAAGKPDFILGHGVRIGVKTVKREDPPKKSYTAQITARHASEPIDHYFFMTYVVSRQEMWLLGGIERETFLREAKYYAGGEWVHPQYQVRKGHEIYNIDIGKLVPPKNWLERFE